MTISLSFIGECGRGMMRSDSSVCVCVQISEVYELHFETMDYFHKTGRSWSFASSFFCLQSQAWKLQLGEAPFA